MDGIHQENARVFCWIRNRELIVTASAPVSLVGSRKKFSTDQCELLLNTKGLSCYTLLGNHHNSSDFLMRAALLLSRKVFAEQGNGFSITLSFPHKKLSWLMFRLRCLLSNRFKKKTRIKIFVTFPVPQIEEDAEGEEPAELSEEWDENTCSLSVKKFIAF